MVDGLRVWCFDSFVWGLKFVVCDLVFSVWGLEVLEFWEGATTVVYTIVWRNSVI